MDSQTASVTELYICTQYSKFIVTQVIEYLGHRVAVGLGTLVSVQRAGTLDTAGEDKRPLSTVDKKLDRRHQEVGAL